MKVVNRHILLKLEEPLGEQTFIGEEVPFRFWILDPKKHEIIDPKKFQIEIVYQEVCLDIGASYLGTHEEIILYSNSQENHLANSLSIKEISFDTTQTYSLESNGPASPILEVSGIILRNLAFHGTVILKARVCDNDVIVNSKVASITFGDKDKLLTGFHGGPLKNLPERVFGEVLIIKGWVLKVDCDIESICPIVEGASSVRMRSGLDLFELRNSLPDTEAIRNSGIELLCFFDKNLKDKHVSVNLDVKFSSGEQKNYFWGTTLVTTSLSKALFVRELHEEGGKAKIKSIAFSSSNAPMRLFLKGSRKVSEVSSESISIDQMDWDNALLDSSYYSSYPPYQLTASLRRDFMGAIPGSVILETYQSGAKVEILCSFIKEKLSLLFNNAIVGYSILKVFLKLLGRHGLLPVKSLHLARESRNEFSKKVLFTSHNLSRTEGAPILFYSILKGVRDKISEVVFVSLEEGEARESVSGLVDKVEVIPELSQVGLSKGKLGEGVRKLDLILVTENPAKVVSNSLDSFPVICQAIDYGSKTVWIIHESVDPSIWFENLSIALRHRFLFALKYVNEVVFVSARTKEMYIPFLGDGGVHVISNGIDVNGFNSAVSKIARDIERLRLGIQPDEFVFLTVGTTTERKGQDRTIRELAEFRSANPDMKFRIFFVGAREIPFLFRLRQQVEGLGMEEQVFFIPETKEVTKYYAIADCFIINSREESSPLVALEAYASKLPLVSTTVFGLKDLVEDGVTGLTFDGDNEGELAGLLLKIVKDKDLRDRLVGKGFEFVKENYSLERMIEGYRELL